MADPTDPKAMVRLLIAAPGANEVFSDDQIGMFLTLERDGVKVAAARALTVIATNEALIAKVIKDGDLATDGPKLAAELRALAKELRDSHAADLAQDQADEEVADAGYFEVVDLLGGH